MILFSCYETNVIIEEPYKEIEAGFCIVEKYDYVYQKELPRFNEKIGIKPYGLPYDDKPKKMYLGIGNLSYENATQTCRFYSESCLKSENEVIVIRDTLFSKEHCDVVWFKVYGSIANAPNGYESCGYDITFVPEINGAYSIINDCMFICKWHGCDYEGTTFHDYFIALNNNGLFSDIEIAIRYMKYYLSFEWTERGEFCICEIFRKKKNAWDDSLC